MTAEGTAGAHRCSAYSRDQGLDPVGSAGGYDGYLLVEHPLPWPPEFSDLAVFDDLRPVLEAAEENGRRFRLQALGGDEADPEALTMIVYRRPPGPFRAFEREEFRVGLDDLPRLCRDLVEGEAGEGWSRARVDVPAEIRDVLFCTHGARDRCCGSSGTRVYMRQRDRRSGLRVWRTSHTGGHRYAPTAISLPDGRYWAYLDGDLPDRVIDRDGPAGLLRNHYRGSSGFADPFVQAAEREAFVRHGWGWLDFEVEGAVAGDPADAEGALVRIDYLAPDGQRGAYEARVAVSREVAILDCGRPPEEARKTAQELRVDDFVPADPGAAVSLPGRGK